MPKKVNDGKLDRVVTTAIKNADYNVLRTQARILYNENKINQPTISHILRFLIEGWVKYEQAKSRSKSQNILFSPYLTPYAPKYQRVPTGVIE